MIDSQSLLTNVLVVAGLVAAILGLAQCNGGGSGGGGGSFEVAGFSATHLTPPIYLNDPVEIEFTGPVNPQTVFTGVFIYTSESAGLKRAMGAFTVDGSRVTFTPRLPTDASLSDSGFKPDTVYTICVPVPDASCAVHVPRSPGVRNTSGRGVTITRIETFRTVAAAGTYGIFRPETVPARPEVERVLVHDAGGVVQCVNPLVNLVTGQSFQAGLLTTVAASPPTTQVPGTTRSVPAWRHEIVPLTLRVTSPIDLRNDVLETRPLTIHLRQPGQPVPPGAFQDRGGVLTIRDSSHPPVEASWAVASSTADRIVTFADSGPTFDPQMFVTPPFEVEVSQGITRQVAPGTVDASTRIQIVFSEPLHPLSVRLDNFTMYSVTDTPAGLHYALIPAATTLQGARKQGLTHQVIDGRSVVTLLPRSAFPRSSAETPATVVVVMHTAQEDNAVPPGPKNDGLRDLNNFALAYPRRTGWILAEDVRGAVSTVGHLRRLDYTGPGTPPESVHMAWGFQTRYDAQVANAVVETFVDVNDRAEDCISTAAWTLNGQAGLFAGYGYGGSGEKGDVVVSGAVVIDSDTLTPGPDGVVHVDYHRLTVALGSTLTLKGSYPIRINAIDEIIVAGTVDASGQAGLQAPAGKASVVGRIQGGRGGPGGGAGGDANPNPLFPSGSLPIDLRGAAGYPTAEKCGDPNRSVNHLPTGSEPNCGGGTGGNRGYPSGTTLRDGCSGNGGGHAGDGRITDGLCSNYVAYGDAFGVSWIVPTGANEVTAPTGATGGGAGGNTAIRTSAPLPSDDIVAGSGGGGGGGVEFQAAGKLTVTGSAVILARGGNGGQGYSTVVNSATVRAGYGGGGAGGSIWLSGTSVAVENGARIEATGGTGNPSPPSSTRSGDGGKGYVIIRDRGDSPTVDAGATVQPAWRAGRTLFDPTDMGKSTACSRWYDSTRASPDWRFDASNPATGEVIGGEDLLWLNPPTAGQSVHIAFQGAPDQNGFPDPDPTSWYPPGNTAQAPCAVWETDLTRLTNRGGLRHLRFRISFQIGQRDKGQPPPNQIAIERVVLHYGE